MLSATLEEKADAFARKRCGQLQFEDGYADEPRICEGCENCENISRDIIDFCHEEMRETVDALAIRAQMKHIASLVTMWSRDEAQDVAVDSPAVEPSNP